MAQQDYVTAARELGAGPVRIGIFGAGEGAGVARPGTDAALLVLVPATALLGLGGAALMRRTWPAGGPLGRPAASPSKGTLP